MNPTEPRVVSIQVGLPAIHGEPGATDPLCLGNVYAIGSARVQVSQPRRCENITHRWTHPGLTRLVERTGRHDWYRRVLQEGDVAAGEPMMLLERPCPERTIARALEAMRRRSADRDEAARLRAVPALSAAWRQTLSQY